MAEAEKPRKEGAELRKQVTVLVAEHEVERKRSAGGATDVDRMRKELEAAAARAGEQRKKLEGDLEDTRGRLDAAVKERDQLRKEIEAARSHVAEKSAAHS